MAENKNEMLKTRELMDAFKIYIPFIKEYGITPTLITQLITEHEPIKLQVKKLRDRYEVTKEGVPIFSRPLAHIDTAGNMQRLDTMVNNKLNNTFDSDIVDTKVGYFLGHPINYAVQKEKVGGANRLIEAIDQMRIRDNLPDKDATFGKYASIGGYAARLCYIGLEMNKPVVRIANVRPEECIFFYTENMSEPRYAMHYYDTVMVQADGSKQNVTVANFYDELNVTTFIKSDGDFVPSEQKAHGFNYTPLFGLENNDELAGEAQKVLNLIDTYDRTFSDASNEIEATRLAVLLLYNLGMDPEDIQKMKQAGVLEMWGEKIDAKYLTKDVNDGMIENHLNRLDKNIMRFAKSIDFTDEQFASNLSGIAILFKTMALEHKSIHSENKMRSSLQYQMKVICSAWSKLGICTPDAYLNIWFSFKRNLPQNNKEAAETSNILKGLVSERTRLSLLPFVDDVEAEIREMKQDQQEFGEGLEEITPIEPENAEEEVVE